jgi:hypothetical protein
MGRHSQCLYIGKRGFLMKKLNKELCRNSRKNIQSAINNIGDNSKGIENKVLYTPLNLPEEVVFMDGVLEINPLTLKEYINELYANSR